jgi:hypothetical protein
MEYSISTSWMDLENIMPNGKQLQEITHYILYDSTYMKIMSSTGKSVEAKSRELVA